MQTLFGSGNLIAKNTASNSTPRQFGILQEVSWDVTWTMKNLYGQYQFAQDIGRGTAKLTGKAKVGTISGALLADIFFQPTAAPGTTQTVPVFNEAKTPSGSPPTCVAANTTGFVDQGVIDLTTGTVMTLVTSSPAAGLSYSVNAGTATYTFGTGQGNVWISYTYTKTSTQKGSWTYDNQLLGTAPTFSVVFGYKRNSKTSCFSFHTCVSSKVSIGSKLEDFTIPDLEFEAFADTSGNVFDYSGDE